MKLLCTLLLLLIYIPANQSNSTMTAESVHSNQDAALDTNPSSTFWQGSRPVYLQVNAQGQPEPEYRTEVRSRWTNKYIYFLFICPYRQLSLKPNPDAKNETYELWNWNVAEVFLGSNFQDIKRYREFEISPQNEWIDLDVDLHKPHHEEGWVWNSGFEHAARIDQAHHIWYAAMKIPFSSLDMNAPAPGKEFRMNLYRTEGPSSASKEVLWQPTMSNTFHVPERFGMLRLASK